MFRIRSAYRVHNDAVDHIAYFPDGHTLLTATHEAVQGADGLVGIVKVWEPSRGVLLSRRDPNFPPYVALSGNGKWIAWGSDTGKLRLIRADGSQPDQEFCVAEARGSVEVTRFFPGKPTLLYRNLEHERCFWMWNVTERWPGEQLPLSIDLPVDVSPDAQHLALGTLYDGTGNFSRVHLWKLSTRSVDVVLDTRKEGIEALSFHPQKPLLAISNQGGGIQVWDYSLIAKPRIMFAASTEGRYLRFLKDDILLAAAEDGELCLWDCYSHRVAGRASTADLNDLQLVEERDQLTITVDRPQISAVSVSANGRAVAVGTVGGVVAFYEVD